MSFNMTTTKPLKIGLNKPDFKKWDIIRMGGVGDEGIVIRVKNVGAHYTHSVQYTIHHYKRFGKRWKQNFWMKWLRLRVWIGDLYIN